MNSDSTGSMLAPWMSPGVNSPLLRFTAKTSMQRVYDVHFPRRVKNEKQSGAEPQTVQEPLRILPEAIRWDMPPETSMRLALTQRFYSESSEANHRAACPSRYQLNPIPLSLPAFFLSFAAGGNTLHKNLSS
jgi:hypothetical protein